MVRSTKSSPNENPAFVPSPRWLSESPARPGILRHVDSVAGHTTSSQGSLDSSQNVWSSAPPAPANLHQESAATFNVDPGIPSTAGSTDAGSPDDGSIKQEPLREKPFVGGLVTGIKKALRNSLRDRMKSRQMEPPLPMYAQPSQSRDSGYGGSISQLNPLPLQGYDDFRSSSSSSHTSHDSFARAPSETIPGHLPMDPKLYDETNIVGPQQIFSPEAMDSPVSAEPEYGSDYVGMAPGTLESDSSLKTYIRRVSKLVHDISTLPWVATERVTVDYYPEHSKWLDELQHHPSLAWSNENDSSFDYLQNHSGSLKIDGSVSSEMWTPDGNPMILHHQISYEGMDLGDEFGERYDQDEQRPVYDSPYPENASQSPPDTIVSRPYSTADPTLQAWPDSGPHTPRPYPHDETWASATSQVQHPPVRLWQTVSANPTPQQRISPGQLTPYSPQPRPLSQPTSHRTAHSTSSRVRRQAPLPAIPHSPSALPSEGGEWQEYPHEMGGYVPYEFAEHYYGDKYGPGVHVARPPLPGAPSPLLTSRTASLLQQQPQGVSPSPRISSLA
jgi:hypothetical protein